MSLSREQQREIGVLVFGVSRALENGLSTLPCTMHASADLMEHLASEEIGLLRDYTAQKRRHLSHEGRAMPDGSFPITSCGDAEIALAMVTKAPPRKRDDVLSYIHRRQLALDCK